ncbi:MAG: haloacid dehalogenase-like hydrolase [Bacteroidales bacterium]|jgi:HAD superfamily hydrolase (TIGR01490 family)|nr:haloacid dehalogenase-like hydrolase [Bacteroidales bacterium]
MLDSKRLIVVFDFDGTITRKDTFTAFIKFAKGKTAFYKAFIRYSPLLLAYKLRLYPNWKIKQKILSHFFKNMPVDEFTTLGRKFISVINDFVRPEVVAILKEYQQQGATVYVISASIENWVEPWCRATGINNIIATRVATDANGLLTGHLSTHNCYGQEKVARLLEREPDRETYKLFVYGDSCGDKELMALADKSRYRDWKIIKL